MMKGLRLRRNPPSTRIRSLDPEDADAGAALSEPIDENGNPATAASAAAACDADADAAAAAAAGVYAKGRRGLVKAGRPPSLASLSTYTTEGSSSNHSTAEEEDAGALRPEHRQPTSTSTTIRRQIGREGRGRGGCLRVKTQQASLQLKFTSKAPTTGCGPTAADLSSHVSDKDPTEYFAATATQSKTVGFSCTTVHSHQLMLGDNPSPTTGPPVSIEWTAFDTMTVPLDDYEKNRSGPPRHHSELQAPGGLRTAWLLRAGYTLEEIAIAEKQIRVIQRRRLASLPSHNYNHPVNSPYNPCGKSNLQLRRGVAKILPRTWARRKGHDDGEAEAVVFVDEP